MLSIHADWDWFNTEPTDGERAALAAGQYLAVIHEDGDEEEAREAAQTAVTTGTARVAVLRPGIGDIVCAIAWDPAVVLVEWDEYDWLADSDD